MILAAILALALNGAATPQQSLNDARLVNVRDGSADLWLALEVQPDAMQAMAGPGEVSMVLAGAACAPRDIAPPSGRPVTRLVLSADGDASCSLRVEGQWETASAHLAEGGVVIALEGVRIAPTPPLAAAAQTGTARVAQAGRETVRGDSVAPASTAGDGAARTPDVSADRPEAPAERGAPVALTPSADGPCEQTGGRLEDTPWDLGAMAAHAGCLFDADQRRDAETLYERVLAFEPGHFAAALGLAQIRADAGAVEEARALFETAAAAARTDGEALAARSAAEALRSASE